MGRYISIGCAFIYSIPKNWLAKSLPWSSITDKSESEIITELKKNFPMDIYSFSTDDNWYHFSLRDDIAVEDFISLYDALFSSILRDVVDNESVEKNRADIVKMKTMYEVWSYSDNSKLHFCPMVLPFYCNRKMFRLFGRIVSVETSINGPTFYMACEKYYKKYRQVKFEVITYLLRYRFKDFKLAQSLLFFLSD